MGWFHREKVVLSRGSWNGRAGPSSTESLKQTQRDTVQRRANSQDNFRQKKTTKKWSSPHSRQFPLYYNMFDPFHALVNTEQLLEGERETIKGKVNTFQNYDKYILNLNKYISKLYVVQPCSWREVERIKGEVSCEVAASAKRPCKGCLGSAIHKEPTWKYGHCNHGNIVTAIMEI